MKSGMLWFDNNRHRPLGEKLKRAAAYYQEKYGELPTTVVMHPSTADPLVTGDTCAGLRVEASNTVLPHHFWLGVAATERGGAPSR